MDPVSGLSFLDFLEDDAGESLLPVEDLRLLGFFLRFERVLSVSSLCSASACVFSHRSWINSSVALEPDGLVLFDETCVNHNTFLLEPFISLENSSTNFGSGI